MRGLVIASGSPAIYTGPRENADVTQASEATERLALPRCLQAERMGIAIDVAILSHIERIADAMALDALYAILRRAAGKFTLKGTDMQESIIMTRREGRVGIITLNRPAQLNALNDALMDALGAALLAMDADDAIGCIVLTGGPKVFAAGADVEAISDMNFSKAVNTNFITRNWETILRVRKPVIGAVAGFALGGGCELAMMCDFIIAADDARFGQPEIKLGIIPGAGGTQRLPRAISKAKAMEMVLTGRMMNADEAERAGMVARTVPADQLEREALASAALIAGMSMPSVMAAKESLNRAYETSLSEGLQFERKSFHALFSTADQKEGMAAFLAKRKPQFSHN